MRSPSHPPADARGFTYLGLLFLVFLMGILAAVAASTWTFVGQREKEQDLLYVGREYRLAIERYRQAHSGQAQPYPVSLAQLLGDGERLQVRRYLRRLYFDPITGSDSWGIVRSAKGGIVGVHSLSERVPIRTRTLYADETIDFARAKSYRDWVFAAVDPATLTHADAPAQAPSGPVPGEGPQEAVTPGNIPGWNYDRDGEPPIRWTTPRPAPVEPGSAKGRGPVSR